MIEKYRDCLIPIASFINLQRFSLFSCYVASALTHIYGKFHVVAAVYLRTDCCLAIEKRRFRRFVTCQILRAKNLHQILSSERNFVCNSSNCQEEHYSSVTRNLREAVRKNPVRMVARKFMNLAPCNTRASLLVRNFFVKNSTNTTQFNSTDMTPCEFVLFSRLKLPLRGHRSESINAIEDNTLGVYSQGHSSSRL